MQINLDDIEFITETTATIRGSRRRTTIPKEIAEHFNLQDGDRLRWVLLRNGTLLIAPKIMDSIDD